MQKHTKKMEAKAYIRSQDATWKMTHGELAYKDYIDEVFNGDIIKPDFYQDATIDWACGRGLSSEVKKACNRFLKERDLLYDQSKDFELYQAMKTYKANRGSILERSKKVA